jgi:hypothetical protein
LIEKEESTLTATPRHSLLLVLVFSLGATPAAAGAEEKKEAVFPSGWPWRGVGVKYPGFEELDRLEELHRTEGIRHFCLVPKHRALARKKGITLQEAWTESLDWMVAALARCKRLGITASVLMDGFPVYENWSSARQTSEFWDTPACQDEALERIVELVERLPTGPELGHIQFFSEPVYRKEDPSGKRRVRVSTPEVWPAFFERIRKTVREHGDFWLGYSPGPGGLRRGYKKQAVFDDPRIVYNAHMYSPGIYTHQGLEGKEHPIEYPGRLEKGRRFWNKKALRESLQPLRDFQLKCIESGRPVPVIINSFSAIRWAPGGEQYLLDLADIFQEYGWSYSYWCLGGAHVWDPDYGNVFDEKTPWQRQFVGKTSVRWNTLRTILAPRGEEERESGEGSDRRDP